MNCSVVNLLRRKSVVFGFKCVDSDHRLENYFTNLLVANFEHLRWLMIHCILYNSNKSETIEAYLVL